MTKKTKPFGEIAIGMGFSTKEDVDKALEIQRQLKERKEPHKLIGMIMLEEGMIDTSQLIEILRFYERQKEH